MEISWGECLLCVLIQSNKVFSHRAKNEHDYDAFLQMVSRLSNPLSLLKEKCSFVDVNVPVHKHRPLYFNVIRRKYGWMTWKKVCQCVCFLLWTHLTPYVFFSNGGVWGGGGIRQVRFEVIWFEKPHTSQKFFQDNDRHLLILNQAKSALTTRITKSMQSCARLDLNCLNQFLPFSADVNTSASASSFSRGSLRVSNKKWRKNTNTEHEHEHEHEYEHNVTREKPIFGHFPCHQLNTHYGIKSAKNSFILIF